MDDLATALARFGQFFISDAPGPWPLSSCRGLDNGRALNFEILGGRGDGLLSCGPAGALASMRRSFRCDGRAFNIDLFWCF